MPPPISSYSILCCMDYDVIFNNWCAAISLYMFFLNVLFIICHWSWLFLVCMKHIGLPILFYACCYFSRWYRFVPICAGFKDFMEFCLARSIPCLTSPPSTDLCWIFIMINKFVYCLFVWILFRKGYWIRILFNNERWEIKYNFKVYHFKIFKS